MNIHLTQLASHSRRPARTQRGVALITVLLVLLILTAIAFGLMYMANTETLINANFRSVQSAFAASQAGLQEARERLMSSNTGNHLILGPTVLPGAPNSIVYLINPRPGEAIDPTTAGAFFDTELCRENFIGLGLALPAGPGQPCTVGAPAGSVGAPILSDAPFAGTNAALPYKWVRITAKANNTACGNATCTGANAGYPVANPATTNNVTPICWDGTHELPLPAGYATCASPPPAGSVQNYKPVFVVTAFALTPSGARRMTQMEVAEMPPILTNAALDTQDLVTTSGASVTLNGFDNCQCACTVGKGGALPTCTFRNGGGNCTGSTYAVYTTQQYSGNGGVVAGTNPTIAQNQTNFPWDINALAAAYGSASGAVQWPGCSGGSCGGVSGGTFGTIPSPFPPTVPLAPNQLAPGEVDQITVFNGSVDLTAHGTGAGVLVVNGDLTIHGGLEFYGLVIVTGRLIISGSGQGQASNITGGILAGEGTGVDTISGGVNLQFDSCALSHNQIRQPPSILAFRELAY